MGRTSLWMFPIYGLGVLLGPIGCKLDNWLTGKNFCLTKGRAAERMVRNGLIYMILIFAAEYLFGWFLTQMGICPWDYSDWPTNINGLIRLDFAPLWFITGLLFEQITGEGKLPIFFVRKE